MKKNVITKFKQLPQTSIKPVIEEKRPHRMMLNTYSTLDNHFIPHEFYGVFTSTTKRDGTVDTCIVTEMTRTKLNGSKLLICTDLTIEDCDDNNKAYFIDIISLDPKNNTYVFRVSAVEDVPKAS